MTEEIDIEVSLGKEQAKKLFGMNKAELRNSLCVLILKQYIQAETIESLEGIEKNLIKQLEEGVALRRKRVFELETKLGQAKGMIESIMGSWD